MPSNGMMYDPMFILSLAMAVIDTLATLLTGVGVTVIAIKVLKS